MSRQSRNNWMTGLASAAQGFTGGYMAGQQANNERRKIQLSEEQVREAVREARRKESDEGFTRSETGDVVFDPDFITAGTPSYKRAARIAELKAQSSPRTVAPIHQLTNAQVFAAAGQPLPEAFKGMEDAPFDHRYLNAIPKPAREQPSMLAGDLQDLSQGKARRDLPVPAPFAGVARQANAPGGGPADPAQLRAYESMMNLPEGAANGFTRQQVSSGFSNVSGQRAAGERQGKAIAASGARQDKALEQGARHHQENKDLERMKATAQGRSDLSLGIAGLERLQKNIGDAKRLNPSGAEYYKLKAKSMANSATFGGFQRGPLKGLTNLTPEEQERLSYYGTLDQDAIRELFAQGGKALTPNEERLSRSLAIQGTDSLPQILAKQEAVRKYATSKFQAQLDELERMNPGGNDDLRERMEAALAGLGGGEAPVENPSDARARSAKGGSANDSARRIFGDKHAEDIMAGIGDPKDPQKNAKAQAAHKKVAPRLYSGEKPPAPKGPKVGAVVDGYRFKGGDPASQKSWEKVK